MESAVMKALALALLALAALPACLQIEEGLPALDQQLLPDVLRPYQLEQQQSFLLECSPEAAILGKLHHSCHVHPPSVEIEALSQLDYGSNSLSKKYLSSPDATVVYALDDSQFVVHSIAADHQQKDKQTFPFTRNCSKDMAFDYSRHKIFVFSCEAVYQMALAETALQMKVVQKNEEEHDIRSVERFQDLLILITSKGVVIYAVDVTLKLIPQTTIQPPSGKQSEIVDAYYANGQLILVDRHTGLLYYKRSGQQFTLFDELSVDLDEEVEYGPIELWKNSTFIAIEGESQSFVAELQTIRKKVYLVRYYKGYDEILKIQVINSSLIIHSNSKIDVFPVNRDPRTIRQALNGYSYSHDQSVLSFEHLTGSKFLLLKSKSVSITEWRFIGKKIECEFPETGEYSIMVEHPCVEGTQRSVEGAQRSVEGASRPFREACSQIQVATITVYHKDTYVWLLLIIIGAFLATALLLICWRDNKVARIVRILQQTTNFKLKRKEIQFKEVQYSSEDASVNKRAEKGNDLIEPKEERDPYEEYLQSQRNNLN